ncbi:MAG: thioredoxin family protein [Myxococcales bacterium]|nr:thioredoxin family protein [Myxococcales bacterium]
MRVAAPAIVITCLALSACSQSAPAPSRVELIEAPAAGGVAAYVSREVARGVTDHVPVLVYVGATWCEPCQDFHREAAAGSLDAALGPLRVLVFDLDRDGERLAAAGYRSDLVPLFARPRPDGRASGSQTDGVQKGGGYVDQLTPRIRALIATSP